MMSSIALTSWCLRHQHYHFNNNVWQLRRWWEVKKPLLVVQIRAGTYRFWEQRVVHSQGEVKEIWSALDALALKALAIGLGEELQPHVSRRCFHFAEAG